MEYIITFLEGVISFISPCVLPMLPVYITYFAGDTAKKKHVFLNALFFVIGFTAVYTLLGLLASSLGAALYRYRLIVNIISGAIVILFGLSYLDVIHLKFFRGMKGNAATGTVLSSLLFGIVYSVSLTPCVGAFFGSAIALAANSDTAAKGALMMVLYSLGMGIPFIISAVLLEKLGAVFTFVKKHYRVINTVCGIFLIAVGLAMAFGLMNSLAALF